MYVIIKTLMQTCTVEAAWGSLDLSRVKSVRSCEEVLHYNEKLTHVEAVVKGLLQLNLSLGACLGHICDIFVIFL